METLENYRFEIPANQFRLTAEDLRDGIQQVNAMQDAAERHDSLQSMLTNLELKDGEPLIDTVYEAVDALEQSDIDIQLAEAETQAHGVIQALTKVIVKGKPGEQPFTVKPPKTDGVQVEISPGGEMNSIQYVRRLPEDKRATRRNQRMSKRHPSGPAGGLLHISDAVPGKHIR